MNKKLIAAAVSAVVAAPMAAHAEISLYGRVNNAIDLNSLSDDSTTDLSNVGSRFGLKGSTELGNGLTVHGQYEFAATSDNEGDADGNGVGDVRVATAGVSGAFGRVDVGNQWSAYFNTFGTLISPTFSLGYYIYSSAGGAPYRASNTIKYSNSFGPVSLQLDVRLNDGNESGGAAEKIAGNGIGLGLSFAVTDNITIAAAYDKEDGLERGAIEAVAAQDAFVTADYDPGTGTVSDGFFVDRIDDMGNVNEANNAVNLIAPVATKGDTPQMGRVIREAVAAVDAQAADDAPDTDRFGISAKVNFGPVWASLGWQNYSVDDDDRTSADDEVDIDSIFLYVGGDIGKKTNWLIGYSEADNGADGTPATAAVDESRTGSVSIGKNAVDAVASTDDSSQITWGIYHNAGGGLRLYYEAASVSSDSLDGDGNKNRDGTRHLLGMRVDF